MAIPQPRVVSSRDDYRRNLNQRISNMTSATSAFATAQNERNRLAEQQRQYDLNNAIALADNIRLTQNKGDWVNFAEENEGLALEIFKGIYGDQDGVELFSEFKKGTTQTKEQILSDVQKYWFVEGGPQGPAGTGRREAGATEVGYQTGPAQGAQPPPPQPQQGERTSIEGFRADIGEPPKGTGQRSAGPQLGTGQRPQQSGGGTYPSLGTGTGRQEGSFYGNKEGHTYPIYGEDTKYRKAYESQADRQAEGQVQGPSGPAPEQKQYETDYRASEAGREPVEEKALYNDAGLAVGEGQDEAPVPINTETIDTVFSAVEVPQGSDASTIATSLSDAVGAYDEEAARFFAQGTAHLRSGSREAWKEYDRKAQEHFGVDGQTLFAIRNQMFDNVEKGRPVNYMPPENERSQWWWTGKDMPPYAKVRDVAALSEPDTESISAASESATKINTASLSGVELRNVDEFIRKEERKWFEEEASNSGGSTRYWAKKSGLPESSEKVVQEHFNTIASGEKADFGLMRLNEPKAYQVLSRVYKKGAEEAKRTTTQAKGRSDVDRAARDVERGSNSRYGQGVLVLTKERQRQIYKELSGQAPLSYEVEQAIPLEERKQMLDEQRVALDKRRVELDRMRTEDQRARTGLARQELALQERQFEEAKRQFDEQIKLQEASQPSKKARELDYKIASTKLAMKELELKFAKKKFEALENGEAAPDITIAYEQSKAIVERYMKDIHDDCESQECVQEQLRIALENPQLRDAYDTYTKILSSISGLPYKEIEGALKERTWFSQTLMGQAFGIEGYKESDTVLPSVGFPNATPQVNPTVTSQGSGGMSGSAGAGYASKYGY